MLALLLGGFGLYLITYKKPKKNNYKNIPMQSISTYVENADSIRFGYLRNENVSLNSIFSDETRIIRPVKSIHLNPILAAENYHRTHLVKNTNLHALYESNKVMDSRKILRTNAETVGRLPRLNNPIDFPHYRGVPTVTFEYANGNYPIDLDYSKFDDTYGNANNIKKHEYIWPSGLSDGLPWAPSGQLFENLRTNHYRKSEHAPIQKTKKRVTFQGVSEF
jgi:hypothetical protein